MHPKRFSRPRFTLVQDIRVGDVVVWPFGEYEVLAIRRKTGPLRDVFWITVQISHRLREYKSVTGGRLRVRKPLAFKLVA